MRMVLFGATGRTGAEILGQAALRGHEVTCVVRDPTRLEHLPPTARAVRGDVLDASTWSSELQGAGAVVSAIGIGDQKAPTAVYSEGARQIVSAMEAHGVRRLAVISAPPAAPREQWSGREWFAAHILFPVLHRNFGATYDDMRRMAAVLAGSEVDWTMYTPPYLTDKRGAGKAKISVGSPVKGARSLPRADLAAVILDGLEDERHFRTTVDIGG